MASSGGSVRGAQGAHTLAYAFLGLCVVVAIGLVFVIQNTMARRGDERRAAEEAAKANPVTASGAPAAPTPAGPVDIEAALAGDGIEERLGEGDKVYAFVSNPGSSCQQSALDVLHDMAAKYPDDMTVVICSMGSDAAEKSVGGSCAGYLVLQNPDCPDKTSTFEAKKFEKSPSAGRWTPDDLRDAIRGALRASGVELEADDAESGAPTESQAEPAESESAKGPEDHSV